MQASSVIFVGAETVRYSGIAQTLNVAADDFAYEDGEVSIRASGDVEVCKDDGDTVWLSSLCADE